MSAQRITGEPVISVNAHPEAGDNINGPSLIRVPEWVTDRLGKYYLYFGHHNGQFIRLAYADTLAGPWTIHAPGVLPLAASGFDGHIASPDIHVDDDNRRIYMYFHGSDVETDAASPQFTRLAESDDGLNFTLASDILGGAYWRVFQWDNYFYALEMPGIFRRSNDRSGPFEAGPQVFDKSMRHSAVALRGSELEVFYSNIGDCPESILRTTVNLDRPWSEWSTGPVTVVAQPIAEQPVNELRDPAVFEEDGLRYLLFSVAGEQGIAISRLP